MPQVSVFLHKSVQDNLDFLATLLDLSRSETVETMLRHVMENDLESDIWENYDELIEALQELDEAVESGEIEDAEEDETEEESEEGD